MLTGARMEVDETHRAALQPLAYFVKPLLLSEYQQLVAELEQLLHTLLAPGEAQRDKEGPRTKATP